MAAKDIVIIQRNDGDTSYVERVITPGSGDQVIFIQNGIITVLDTVTSGGAGSNGKLPLLNADGTLPLDMIPKGAVERVVNVADQTARFALTTNEVQLGDVVKQQDTGAFYYVVDEAELNNAAGYDTANVTSIAWTAITDKPDLAQRVSVPATPSSPGVLGDEAIEDDYFYVCVAANTWKRTTLTTW